MSTGPSTKQKQADATTDFMRQLEADTLGILMGVEAKSGSQTQELDQQMDSMEHGLQDAMAQKDERLKQARLRIIKADAAKLREGVAKEEQDLAVAMVGLKELMSKIGIDYEELTQPDSNEKDLVERAKARVRSADLGVEMAKTAWFFRESKVLTAQQQLDKARAELKSAEAESKKLARQRLMNATLDKSLQHFVTQVGKVVDIMTRRQKAIEEQLEKVTIRRTKTLQMKQEAARKVEELDVQLSGLEQKLQTAEQEFANLTNGTAEFVAAETNVAQLRSQVETIRGDRNTALAVYNSKERFAEELQIHETTQRKLRDNQRIWIALLRSDTQDRLVTFASRLNAMKGISDQQVAQGVDQIGTEIDGRNAEMLAEFGAVSDRIRQEMFEAQPQRFRRILNAMGAQFEAIADMRVREQRAMEEFRKRYGVDPKSESFFAFGSEGGESAPSS